MRHDPVRLRRRGRLTVAALGEDARLSGRVLVIAGSDSGGGAGIQADIKAVMAMGGFAATALTAVTAQNTIGVHAVHPIPPAMVRAQIAAVLDDIGADAIKTGMLGEAETVAAVADMIAATSPTIPLVVDPVMIAKGGQALLADDALQLMRRRLLPAATLVTPNLPEAQALLGGPIADPVAAASALRDATGAEAILLKGGHGVGPLLRDVLVHPGGVETFVNARIDTRHTHGTGCTLASAIAAGLAQKLPLVGAVARAIDYVQAAIRTAPGFGRGHGALNHNAAFARAKL